MQGKAETKQPNYNNLEFLRFLGFISTEGHFKSSYRKFYVKKVALV